MNSMYGIWAYLSAYVNKLLSIIDYIKRFADVPWCSFLSIKEFLIIFAHFGHLYKINYFFQFIYSPTDLYAVNVASLPLFTHIMAISMV